MKGTKAFSLVELLVVIAIVTLLSAMLLPSLARAREYARNSVCMSNLRQIGIGFYNYSLNEKDKFPLSYTYPHPGPSSAQGRNYRRIGTEEHGMGDLWLLEDVWGKYPSPWGNQSFTQDHLDYYLDPANARYIYLELMWCTAVVARNWDRFWNQYRCGTAKERHILIYYRRVHGFETFLSDVGCPVDQANHMGFIWHSEEPFRPATSHKHVTPTSKPSAWLTSCPIKPDPSRNESGHFFRQTGLGYKFNVLHLDGHVFTHTWLSPYTDSFWTGSSNKNQAVYGGIDTAYDPEYGFDKNR